MKTVLPTQEQVNGELKGRRNLQEHIYMMGTDAFTKGLADISSDEYDIFHTKEETDNYYLGSWVTGFGFFDVMFPKTTSRRLTEQEVEEYKKHTYQISNQRPYKLQDLK